MTTMEKDKRTTDELERSICRLTANLLRIVAGAGKVEALGKQLEEAHLLANEVAQRGWSYADNAMENALRVRFPFLTNASSDSDRAFNAEQRSIQNIVDDALRIAAARLVGDSTNTSKNTSQLFYSVRQYVDVNPGAKR